MYSTTIDLVARAKSTELVRYYFKHNTYTPHLEFDIETNMSNFSVIVSAKVLETKVNKMHIAKAKIEGRDFERIGTGEGVSILTDVHLKLLEGLLSLKGARPYIKKEFFNLCKYTAGNNVYIRVNNQHYGPFKNDDVAYTAYLLLLKEPK